MAKFYNLSEIKASIINDIARTKKFIELWECVTFPTKKDGKPFKDMQRNINGAHYFMPPYNNYGENRISVCANVPGVGYVSDELNCYVYVRYGRKDFIERKPQNISNGVYSFDLEDIKILITEHIDYLKNHVAQLQHELEIAEPVFYAFRDSFLASLQKLSDDTGKAADSTLYYDILDTVVDRCRYMV